MGSLADNPHDPGLNTAMQHDQLVDMRLLSVVPSTFIAIFSIMNFINYFTVLSWNVHGGQFNTSIIVSMSQSITLEIQASNQTWSLSEIYTSPIPDPDQIPRVAVLFLKELAWTNHPLSPMLGLRSGGRDVLRGLDTVREEPVIFNKMKFGNLFRRKRRSEAPLNGVQRRCTPFFHALTMVVRKRNRVKRWF
ncbi:hypothetical protein D5086_031709 [Populus alba]|uniref:Uncharacterized protein n=1 Tax=Populus alba TaxID=43335 RepID=A0ACC4AJD7_POPAL